MTELDCLGGCGNDFWVRRDAVSRLVRVFRRQWEKEEEEEEVIEGGIVEEGKR